jgi:MoxR-like ATPase
MVEIVRLTRSDGRLQLGCSPRGTLKLFRAAQAAALVAGREFVLPDDVQRIAGAVLRHRVIVGRSADARRQGVSEIVADIVEQVSVPV